MDLAERMQILMDEVRAIKLISGAMQRDFETDISINSLKKLANLLSMIDGLDVPEIVCSFESVEEQELINSKQSGLA
tara:strand:- start:42 stop:272 length:231 start_codon:yes stop_codon:yes gene_type:complete